MLTIHPNLTCYVWKFGGDETLRKRKKGGKEGMKGKLFFPCLNVCVKKEREIIFTLFKSQVKADEIE